MSAHGALQIEHLDDQERLDTETSAAVLHWMDTAAIPEGISNKDWEAWMDSGCQGRLEANGQPVTPEMLARWARSGLLS